MTNKEFFNAIISADLSAEITAKAQHLLDTTEKKSGKRAEAQSANQSANLAIFNTLASLMKSGTTYAISEIKTLASDTEYAECSTAKLSAVFRLAVENGLATVMDNYKVGGKGRTVKGYAVKKDDEIQTLDNEIAE